MTRAVLVLAAACALFAALPAHGGQGSRTLLQYGDSLSVGTGLYLAGSLRGWSVSESYGISRHAYEAPGGLRALGSGLPRVIVISLGTNDDPSAVARFSRYVRDVVSVAGPGRCVIWSTIVRPAYAGVSYDGYNAVLRRAARTYRTLRVFDWQAMARANPQWFGGDGVHPTVAGYRARAAALARLAKTCP